MTIPIPPIEIQREIIHILDNLTEVTAELTAKLEARLYTKESISMIFMRQNSSLKQVVICVERVSEIAKFVSGYQD